MSSPPECGPEAVDTVPVTTRAAQAATPTQATFRSHDGPAAGAMAAMVAPGLDHDDDGARHDEKREQEMRHHGDGVEVEQHGDPAERNLGDRAERREQRDDPHPPRQPVDAPCREPGDEREDDADEGHHAIAELDRGVTTRSGIGLVAAARPVVAAETRGRQAYDGTARDDHPEREKRDARELKESSRRDDAAHAGGLHGVGGLAAAHRNSTPDPSTTRPTR